jgi:hydrogenase maturation protein HypF
MLPYTPLHELLLKDNFLALVMTSGNLSDEPIAFEDTEAMERLQHIADYFLIHNRRIDTRVDDSIARVFSGKGALLRRSRGYVPQTLTLAESGPVVLGVGAELKSTICLTRGDQACVSQHIGDLKNEEIYDSFCRTISHLQQVLDVMPEAIAHDLHPDFQSTHYAQSCTGIPHFSVQHHHAHLASCLAENTETGMTIGVILDGLGLGSDGTIWGGEFLLGDLHSFKRLGHLDLVGMPGGDAAVREPRRMAFAYLVATYGEALPQIPLLSRMSAEEQSTFRQMLERNLNSPLTSSCGRLFDAVAALVGLRDIVSYEGQAALELEQIASEGEGGGYPFSIEPRNGTFIIDWRPLLQALVADLLTGIDTARVSARFHNSMASIIIEGCRRCSKVSGVSQVALSGGVFQNALLMEIVLPQLRDAGFKVLTHALVPPNDGGLSLGQAAVARARMSVAPSE